MNLVATLHKTLGIKQIDIVIITPYKANIAALRRNFDGQRFNGVDINSTDSFHGREASIVILVLVVNEVTGRKFVGNLYRICVGLTKHRDFLFVVGNVRTLWSTFRSEPGLAFERMFEYFVKTRRAYSTTPNGKLQQLRPGLVKPPRGGSSRGGGRGGGGR